MKRLLALMWVFHIQREGKYEGSIIKVYDSLRLENVVIFVRQLCIFLGDQSANLRQRCMAGETMGAWGLALQMHHEWCIRLNICCENAAC